jgi:hypothetical protein
VICVGGDFNPGLIRGNYDLTASGSHISTTKIGPYWLLPAISTGARIGSAFRIGSMGALGDVKYDAYNPSAAWNSADNEYLVVWSGDDNTRGTANEEYEIFAQRIEANTGNLIGANFRISEMGPNLNADYDAYVPDVAYNAFSSEYWVTWVGDDNTGGYVDEELRGRRV